MNNPQDYLFVGVDTHKAQHTAVVINCFHQKNQICSDSK